MLCLNLWKFNYASASWEVNTLALRVEKAITRNEAGTDMLVRSEPFRMFMLFLRSTGTSTWRNLIATSWKLKILEQYRKVLKWKNLISISTASCLSVNWTFLEYYYRRLSSSNPISNGCARKVGKYNCVRGSEISSY